jgi:hypothetical protein
MMMDWQEMDIFSGVDLKTSDVRRWNFNEHALIIELRGHLLPTHPAFEKPVNGAKACCKPARVVFPFPSEAQGLRAMSEVRFVESESGTRSYGTIAGLTLEEDGSYLVSGTFGEVTIQSMAVRFEVTSQKQCVRG